MSIADALVSVHRSVLVQLPQLVGEGFDFMPTVAYFAPAWPASTTANGITTYVDRMVRGLPGTGWQSVVLAGQLSAPPDTTVTPAYSVQSLGCQTSPVRKLFHRLICKPPRQRETADAVARSFAQIVKKHGIDLIEMEESFGWVNEVSRLVSIPVVARLHGPWFLTGSVSQVPDDAGFKERVRLEGVGIAAAAAVTAPSRNVLESTRQHYPFQLDNSKVIPNPAAIEDTAQESVPIKAIMGRVILYVGRFERLKGGDLAVLAFAELAKQCSDMQFVFIGPESGIVQSDGTKVNTLEFASRQFPAESQNRFHYMGQQPPAVVNAWRCRADVVIVASRYENFPLAILEAMQAGKAIVATAVGGIPEILTHEETGLLVKPDCVFSLAHAVKRLLDDRQLAARLGQNALRDVQQRFSLETVVDQTLSFYDSVLQNWKTTHD